MEKRGKTPIKYVRDRREREGGGRESETRGRARGDRGGSKRASQRRLSEKEIRVRESERTRGRKG